MGKNLSISRRGGWVDFAAGLDRQAGGKALCFCWGSNPGRPVCSQTLAILINLRKTSLCDLEISIPFVIERLGPATAHSCVTLTSSNCLLNAKVQKGIGPYNFSRNFLSASSKLRMLWRPAGSHSNELPAQPVTSGEVSCPLAPSQHPVFANA
jgi:hypothetical protein